MSRPYDRAILFCAAITSIAVVLNAVFIVDFIFLGLDFSQIWVAGRLALDGRLDVLFSPDAFTAASHAMLARSYPDTLWSYPPTTLLIAAPFALAPYQAAVWLWFALQAAACSATVIALTRRVLGPGCALAAALTAPALVIGCVHGQFSMLIACLLIGAVVILPIRAILAGVLTGLIAVKPQFGLMPALLMIINREWPAVLAAAGTALALCFAATICFGPGIWIDFILHTIPDQAAAVRDLATYSWSAHSVVDALLLAHAPKPLAIFAQVLTSALALAAGLVAIRRQLAPAERAFILGICAVLILPYVNTYEQAIPAMGALALYGSPGEKSKRELAAMYFLWLWPNFDYLLDTWRVVRIAPFVEALILADFLLRSMRGRASERAAPERAAPERAH